jgi:hypothetical protein
MAQKVTAELENDLDGGHRAHHQPFSRPVLSTRPQQMPRTATLRRGAQPNMARAHDIAGRS